MVVALLSEPLSGAVTSQAESLHPPSVGEVRAAAQIDQVATPVNRGARSIGHLRLDDLAFEGIVLEQLGSLLFGHYQPLELLLLLGDSCNLLLDLRNWIGLD